MQWKSAEELDELDRRERAARELEARSKRLEAEAEAKAAAIVAMKDKELEDKRKAHEAEQNELAVKRRCVLSSPCLGLFADQS